MRHIDREARILELAAGRRVLHLGCVGYHWDRNQTATERYANSLHAKIQRVAAEVVGVDIDAGAIAAFEAAGIDSGMVVGSVEDLEQLDLGAPFDFIVSGNVIEHLSNPGRMLDGMRALSHPGTVILVTTPHALGLRQYIGHLRGRLRESKGHLMTFNAPSLSNIVERHGFNVLSVDSGHNGLDGITWRGRAAHAWISRFPRFGRLLVLQAEVT